MMIARSSQRHSKDIIICFSAKSKTYGLELFVVAHQRSFAQTFLSRGRMTAESVTYGREGWRGKGVRLIKRGEYRTKTVTILN